MLQTVINKIMKLHTTGNPILYNIPKNVDKSQLFLELLSNTNYIPISNNNNHNINFKMQYYYNIFDFVVNEINKVYNNKNSDIKVINSFDYIIRNILLKKLSGLFKGQQLLNKISHRINKFFILDNHILEYLIESSRYGTFMNFMFWLNRTTYKTIDKLPNNCQEDIFIFSIGNSDDRLFKFILNKIIINNKLLFQQNTLLIKNLIKILGNSLVPQKYILKRIKILSGYISLIPFFQDMIDAFNSDKVLLELHKYYYVVPHNFSTIKKILSNFIIYNWNNETNSNDVIITDNLKLFIKKLLTIEEKVMVNIIIGILYNTYQTRIIHKQKIIDNIVNDNYINIIEMITWNDINISNILLNQIITSLTSQKLTNKYFITKNNYTRVQLAFYTRFLPIYSHNYIYNYQRNPLITINLFLHKLRIYIKSRLKNRLIKQKVKIFDLLSEIKHFNPKKNISILKQGSLQYQYQKQKFSNLPPRHLLPGEINIYQHYLLKEKADGILINNIPIGIYPHVQILNNYQVKAEYIEDLDLYLIFDIDIPNTSIEERYDILRKNHPLTCNTSMQNINSFDDFIKIFKCEREIIKQFLIDNNSEPIKWFPKFACKYNFNNINKLNIELIQKIILAQDKEIHEIISNSNPYMCDGLILTPLDGTREIKIKPQCMMSLDLLFNNNKWLDRNNNDWSHIIINQIKKKEGRIYRCYPDNTFNKYIVGEHRYDKKKPNPYNIVDITILIVKYNWLHELNQMKTYYYDSPKKIISNELIKIIKTQYDNLISEIVKLSPELNKSWLDLGCGKGKLIPIIKKYNPTKYLGMDADIKQLVKALHYTDVNQDVYTFNPCNLDKVWNDTPIKWNSQTTKIKYDYIIANFSLMHFCTDAFWLQLNEIVHSKTIFMFNLVALPENTENEWMLQNSYLKIKDNKTIYKFEWIHDEEKTEPYISDEEINEYIKKYNWTVLNNHQFNSKHSLVNFYKWWILTKKY